MNKNKRLYANVLNTQIDVIKNLFKMPDDIIYFVFSFLKDDKDIELKNWIKMLDKNFIKILRNMLIYKFPQIYITNYSSSIVTPNIANAILNKYNGCKFTIKCNNNNSYNSKEVEKDVEEEVEEDVEEEVEEDVEEEVEEDVEEEVEEEIEEDVEDFMYYKLTKSVKKKKNNLYYKNNTNINSDEFQILINNKQQKKLYNTNNTIRNKYINYERQTKIINNRFVNINHYCLECGIKFVNENDYCNCSQQIYCDCDDYDWYYYNYDRYDAYDNDYYYENDYDY